MITPKQKDEARRTVAGMVALYVREAGGSDAAAVELLALATEGPPAAISKYIKIPASREGSDESWEDTLEAAVQYALWAHGDPRREFSADRALSDFLKSVDAPYPSRGRLAKKIVRVVRVVLKIPEALSEMIVKTMAAALNGRLGGFERAVNRLYLGQTLGWHDVSRTSRTGDFLKTGRGGELKHTHTRTGRTQILSLSSPAKKKKEDVDTRIPSVMSKPVVLERPTDLSLVRHVQGLVDDFVKRRGVRPNTCKINPGFIDNRPTILGMAVEPTCGPVEVEYK